MFGKITVIKSLLIPKFTYLLQAIAIPNNIVKQINSMLYSFLWGNNKEKIKRTTLIGNKLEGGLKLPDIEIKGNEVKMAKNAYYY